MTRGLYCLTYLSTAAATADGDLDQLVASARERNATNGVRALLFYNGLNFLQTLEGPRVAVTALFERIANDTRHSGLKIIDAGAIDRAVLDGGPLILWTAGADECNDQIPAALPDGLRTIYLAFAGLGAISHA